MIDQYPGIGTRAGIALFVAAVRRPYTRCLIQSSLQAVGKSGDRK